LGISRKRGWLTSLEFNDQEFEVSLGHHPLPNLPRFDKFSATGLESRIEGTGAAPKNLSAQPSLRQDVKIDAGI
jgi:hypothetical protein